MSIFDIGVIFVLAVFGIMGYKKGVFRSTFNLLSIIISLYLSKYLYPFISTFIKSSTGIYSKIKYSIVEQLNLSYNLNDTGIKAEHEFIASLELPEFIINSLLENNNYEVYNILDVTKIEDFIGEYIANLVVNALSLFIVFIVTFILVKFIFISLDIFSKLPIINPINKILGFFIGIIQGLLVVWISNIILLYFLTKKENLELFNSLKNSLFAYYLFENNLIINLITLIF